MTYTIGVDGGGSKTECILVDEAGQVLARHVGPGSNPSVVGADGARSTVTEALRAVRSGAAGGRGAPRATLLCMAGSPGLWQEFAATLSDFGTVTACDDSLPVLELATQGEAGLVLHAGTGSFVAARAPGGSVHYAGGLGWRFGDPGSGYDLGRRAIGQALLEMQGWAPPSGLSAAVRQHAGLADGAALMRAYYADSNPNARIATLAPAVLDLAAQGDAAAGAIATASAGELLDLGREVAARLFPRDSIPKLRAGLSGPILSHPFVSKVLAERSPFPLSRVEDAPAEGVRRMLLRLA